jgi:NAD-dependent SIR2 family protein deacetylase
MKTLPKYRCKRCRVEISEKEFKTAEEKKQLPLCKICKPIIDEKLKKWYPIFQKFKF